ncbi:hypothetical protein H4R33_006680 [Dimargaris cristalligena]|nr:hypothetical protein H4R33_006680 [Dimargaris cristalligena]
MESLTQWDVNKVYSWFCSLGFQAYEKQIRDNQITGEVLLHLHHEALRDLSIDSLGKRLVILKAIYQLKLQHRVPITTEDYVPPDIENGGLALDDPAEGGVLNQVENLLEEQELMITHLQREVTKLVREVGRLNHEFTRLRDDVRPPTSAHPGHPSHYWGGHPLAGPGPGSSGPKAPSNGTPTAGGLAVSSKRPAPILTKVLGSPKPHGGLGTLNGSYSQSAVSLHAPSGFGNSSASNLSPMTAVSLGPGGVGSGSISGASGSTIPASPSSPSEYFNYKAHTYQDISMLKRSGSLQGIDPSRTSGLGGASTPCSVTGGSGSVGGSGRSKHRSIEKIATPPGTTPLEPNGDSVIRVFGDKGIHREHESYKTFRISIHDPCHKILPHALKKYNITDDWRNYNLCIVFGTSEHRLQLEEKPLKLFQQLQAANESPYFVLKFNKSASTSSWDD